MHLQSIKQVFQFGEHQVSIESQEIARQSDAAVIVKMADTVVLVTCVVVKENDPSKDFFPLTVNYQERMYAAGRIPGGFLRREGRASEKETLTARLIDRPLRPLFAEGFTNEVQIIATVLSIDPEIDPDIPSMIGASAAVSLAGLPFSGPIGAARVGYINGQYVLNPRLSQMKSSDLDLVVAGTANAVLMVESEAKVLSEETMLEAVVFGHESMQVVINNIRQLCDKVSVKPFAFAPVLQAKSLADKIHQLAFESLTSAYQIAEKQNRQEAVKAIKLNVLEAFAAEATVSQEAVVNAFDHLCYRIVRDRILEGQPRIDGRDNSTVRSITSKVGVLPRTHGSALFTRGETQALVVVTLGTDRNAQIVDALEGEYRDAFMLHYNFPPYSVGEVGMVGSPKRREIGHGRLAKRGVQAVMPSVAEYPYVVRVVSEITESNGSSSMASVCGASLALMDAGVPIHAPVAGIAMGLIKEGDRYAVLTDILGDEDHLGDMDFKVAGTQEGVTALQMDIKIDGITKEIMQQALSQAKAGRLHILQEMSQTMTKPREEISAYAPRITIMRINPDKIRDVIGKGGATIRALTEETGTTIEIDDDGTIRIAATNNDKAQEARRRIEMMTADVEVGQVYEGEVVRLMDFGAFVNLMPGRDGMVHISQVTDEKRLQNMEECVKVGDRVKVKVLEIDKQGRIRLTMKGF